jgi:hypothetical protein
MQRVLLSKTHCDGGYYVGAKLQIFGNPSMHVDRAGMGIERDCRRSGS